MKTARFKDGNMIIELTEKEIHQLGAFLTPLCTDEWSPEQLEFAHKLSDAMIQTLLKEN